MGFRYFEVETINNTFSQGAQNIITGVATTASQERLSVNGNTPTAGDILADVFATKGQVGGQDEKNSDNGINPRFGIEYRANHDLLVYSTISKGYRTGGVNSGLAVGLGAPSSFESDELWNYELGMKSYLFNGKATLNGAVYYIDWEDIISVGSAGEGFRYRTNAGSASVTGIELDAAIQATGEMASGGLLSCW